MSTIKRLGIQKIKALGLKRINENNAEKNEDLEYDDSLFINTTEIDTVKTLFQIRNGNFYKKKVVIKSLSNPISNYYLKERIFIAGKIFPVLNLIYKNYITVLDTRKIELRNWKFNEGFYNPKVHNRQYISIDNDNLRILLPISYGGVNFPDLMLDFLTNGKKTEHTIGGEFPDYQTYKLALREKAINTKDWQGQDGCWLMEDRGNTQKWENAQDFIIKNRITGRLAPFMQIASFYGYVGKKCRKKEFNHEIKWYKGAFALVDALKPLEGGSRFIANDIETILNELNLGICDYAITQFYELFYGKYSKVPLKGKSAYEFDKKFIIFEQGKVAPPIYKKASNSTIEKFQNMADKDPQSGWHGLGGFLNTITPEFDDPWGAKVTDDGFRIDLPLLMLYLDIHKPTWEGFKKKNMLDKDGYLKPQYKKIIEAYEIK
ncbi:hypothetical protein HZP98_13520 [Elizabethkingia anophelis]|nr:hypothetical protein [Elizabethkingia anophelis]MCT3953089.1 hypothetical protein [Elizabethkingia anophelis]MCT3956595.1 hypothetical protein [Elizabethkingia anophelis]MCT3988285.1 hypothetical protein [Elizabethkingia anophelis]MCT4066759.1 hypothetical protein [Elizabethkingia anophelis]